MVPELFWDSVNGVDMILALIFGGNEDIIEVNNNKNVQHLSKNLIDEPLETWRSVWQPKKHFLILELSVTGHKTRILFVSFSISHLILGISQVKLGETFGSI